MMLCLDVGNSHIYGGLFDGEEIKHRFRHASKMHTSDELGIFLKAVLRENKCDPSLVNEIGICSVVPQLDYSLRAACVKYFDISPFFLQAGVKTGLNIQYSNPIEVGADRIANAIAATERNPGKNIIIIDFGTATTFCVISHKKSYLGGSILPGVSLSVNALSENTAKLPSVEIKKVDKVVGRSTIESIQSGVYFGMLGACKEILEVIKKDRFSGEPSIVLATGGFATLYSHHNLFDALEPDLVLEGLRIALKMNQS